MLLTPVVPDLHLPPHPFGECAQFQWHVDSEGPLQRIVFAKTCLMDSSSTRLCYYWVHRERFWFIDIFPHDLFPCLTDWQALGFTMLKLKNS
mmetsp:Transcript_27755/g.37495  ORF Transcript_27755/g.37495 Transcript_27755/m.37495 type:complete len:92 (-) Transcript_27755:84-359(-)